LLLAYKNKRISVKSLDGKRDHINRNILECLVLDCSPSLYSIFNNIRHYINQARTSDRKGVLATPEEITENLTRGCIDTLAFKGVSAPNIHELHVPGAVELVYAAAKNLDSKRFDAIIVIGCVIRGETAHFDYVCKSVTDGVTELNLRAQLPVIFCVLTDDTLEQSRARSGGALGNKGEEAALAALRMAML
jgi:6,7-dimethyl-8-ribityllumazine synthase